MGTGLASAHNTQCQLPWLAIICRPLLPNANYLGCRDIVMSSVSPCPVVTLLNRKWKNFCGLRGSAYTLVILQTANALVILLA